MSNQPSDYNSDSVESSVSLSLLFQGERNNNNNAQEANDIDAKSADSDGTYVPPLTELMRANREIEQQNNNDTLPSPNNSDGETTVSDYPNENMVALAEEINQLRQEPYEDSSDSGATLFPTNNNNTNIINHNNNIINNNNGGGDYNQNGFNVRDLTPPRVSRRHSGLLFGNNNIHHPMVRRRRPRAVGGGAVRFARRASNNNNNNNDRPRQPVPRDPNCTQVLNRMAEADTEYYTVNEINALTDNPSHMYRDHNMLLNVAFEYILNPSETSFALTRVEAIIVSNTMRYLNQIGDMQARLIRNIFRNRLSMGLNYNWWL